MPIYMDRHDIPKEITAEHVAQMHQEDLKVQHLFGCRGMTYWCDEERRTAFCLIEAPNKRALQDMHNQAHGDVPNSIIEVNEKLVASFLGRIEDPEKQQDTELNIIKDSAFRIIMAIGTSNCLHRPETDKARALFTQNFHNGVTGTITQFNGSIAKRNNKTYLVSFKSVSNAILCALKIQRDFKSIITDPEAPMLGLKIGISSGSPITNKGALFEETITLAQRLCEATSDQVVISSDVKTLYESENGNTLVDKELIRTLKPDDEKSLTQLMDFIERIWNRPDFNVDDFSRALGHSKSQLYRKLISLTGKSPNTFLKEFRLRKALDLLHDQKGNISEIAFETGFNSPAYFSKCFKNKFGVLPSEYIQQYVA